jgi:uracil-DNA glycosylase family 4
MENWVLGTGPSSAKLMIVGEAPSKFEDELKKPFVGKTGELVTEILENTGMKRTQVYLTNIVKVRPPGNDLTALCAIDNPKTGEGYKIEDFLPLLWNEIEALQPNCILALGTLALETLTGQHGIKNCRGSIYPCINFGMKVVPTIHPAAIMERDRQSTGMFTWKQKIHIQFDFAKAVRESATPKWNLPVHDLRVIRSSLALEQFFNSYPPNGKIYVDVEVYKSHLVCIGFSFTRTEGISIPLIDLQSNSNPNGIPLHEMVELWKIIAEKLADFKLKKIGQNFKGDKLYWLETAGFVVNNVVSDNMFKIHTLSPELPKSLAFQISIFTNGAFHKNEGKEYNPRKDKLDVLCKYNAKDCVTTAECDEEMDKELEELGLTDFFYNFVMPLAPVYEEMERRGIRIDLGVRDELSEFYADLLEGENKKVRILLEEFGITEFVNFNSPKQVAQLIYVDLRCPRRKDTRDETLTQLMGNAVKDKRKARIIQSILNRRSIGKVKSTYIDVKIDFDGRMRCSTNQVGTETGRTSTSIIKKPLRTGKWGAPFQTIPRADEFGGKIRTMFIPDPGKIMINFDQAQAEARVVFLLAKDYEFLRLMDLLDIHRLTAAFCYNLLPDLNFIKTLIAESLANNKAPDDLVATLALVSKQERQVGKNTRHGLAYDESEQGLAIKQKISLYRAKQTYKKVHEISPNIKEVYHEAVQQALAENDRVLSTCFGRRREFFNKWGKDLFREAYAHIPQSTVGDNTKRAMLGIHQEGIDWIEFLEEGHDSFLAQIPETKVEECYALVKPIFEQPLDFERCTIQRPQLTIPVDCQIGYNWGEMETFNG